MRYLWRSDRPHALEPVQIIAHAIEQPLTAAEERRHKVDLHLVHEASLRALHLTAGGSPRLLKRRFDASYL